MHAAAAAARIVARDRDRESDPRAHAVSLFLSYLLSELRSAFLRNEIWESREEKRRGEGRGRRHRTAREGGREGISGADEKR